MQRSGLCWVSEPMPGRRASSWGEGHRKSELELEEEEGTPRRMGRQQSWETAYTQGMSKWFYRTGFLFVGNTYSHIWGVIEYHVNLLSSGSEEKVLCLFTSFSNFVIVKKKLIKRKMSSTVSDPVTNYKLIL